MIILGTHSSLRYLKMFLCYTLSKADEKSMNVVYIGIPYLCIVSQIIYKLVIYKSVPLPLIYAYYCLLKQLLIHISNFCVSHFSNIIKKIPLSVSGL